MRWTAGLMIAMLIFCDSSAARAGEKKDLSVRLKQEKADLDRLKARIKMQEKSIYMAGVKETSLLKNLRIIDERLEVQEKELRVLHLQIEENKEQINSLEVRLAKVSGQVKSHSQLMAGRIRAMYKEGPLFGIKALFSSESMVDMLRRIKYMEALAAFDVTLFRDYDERKSRLQEKRDDLVAARDRLLLLERERQAKKQEIENQKKEKSRFLNEIRKEKGLGIKVREELLTASKGLNSLIESLKEELEQDDGVDIAQRKGKLRLPVEGKFLNKFGRKRDKQYDSYIVYNGINIEAARGTPVHAVFSGKVLYAGPLEGYGNLIILGHGKEHHSLYGHLDSTEVKVGQAVKTGEVIARSGDSGSLVGETLYFEIRRKGKPVEPTRWFNLAKR